MKVQQSDVLWQYIKGFQYAYNYAELYYKYTHEIIKHACGECIEYRAWDAQMRQMFNKMHLIQQNLIEEYRMLKTFEVSGHIPHYTIRKRKFMTELRKAKYKIKGLYIRWLDSHFKNVA